MKYEPWNPVTGCTKISEGCLHCYAERMALRFAGKNGYPKNDPFQITIRREKLRQPLSWKKPRFVFLCSMADLFHEDVPFDIFRSAWEVMLYANHHTYMIITKRPSRMAEYISAIHCDIIPKHIQIGVTAENQERANERIPILMEIPAEFRFVCCEPLLGHVNLAEYSGLNRVVCGGETGPCARYMDPNWAYALRDYCLEREISFYLKQMGDAARK